MQINKPPSSGTPTTGSGVGAPPSNKANSAVNALAKLVGQVVSAQVVQSKAIQIAAAQATVQENGVAARLLLDQGADRKNATGNTAPTTTSATTPATTSASTSAATDTAQSGPTPPTQTVYQTTLQIGNDRIVVTTEQPLPPGTQLMLKVSSPQLLQMVEQPAATPTVTTSDIADNLLSTLLRQALPLQQPIAKLLGNIASDLLLPDINQSSAPVTGSGATSLPLATTALNLPSNLSPALVAALKPLLTQIVSSQLTLDRVTDPGALRDAVANSGLFREARVVQWVQALLKQFPDIATRGAPASNAGVATAAAGALIPATAGMPASPVADPLAAALQTIAVRTAATQSAANQIASALPTQNISSSQNTNNHATTPTIEANTVDARQADIIRSATASASSPTALHEAIDADSTDVDALRKQLLQALGERAQKNQPAFAGAIARANPMSASATTPSTTVQPAKTAAGMTAASAAAVTAKMAEAELPRAAGASAPSIATPSVTTLSVATDNKTALEQLVSLTSQRLLGSSAKTNNTIDEDQVLAILRQLPMAHTTESHAATRAKPQDEEQWLLQLLRSSFGALKHLQLQQATNIGAAPGTQPASHENPVAPLQIELPILVAQQWQNIHIEIDRRAPDNAPDTGKKERSWRVTLRFELPQQGIIVAQLNLSGVQVNATLWAEKQATCQQLQQQLKELSDRLGKTGAHVTTLDVRHGQPPAAKTRIEQRLIDIRT